jgi:hypothetical protein
MKKHTVKITPAQQTQIDQAKPSELEAIALTPALKRAALLRVFSEDISLFAQYFFPHHLKSASPPFHNEIYKLYTDQSQTRVAICAPRG